MFDFLKTYKYRIRVETQLQTHEKIYYPQCKKFYEIFYKDMPFKFYSVNEAKGYIEGVKENRKKDAYINL